MAVTAHPARIKPQAGYMLLEALVAMLVFAIGVLGVVSLQAVSVKNSGAAKFRTDASMLANQLIGEMWASNRTALTLKTQFQGGPQDPEVEAGDGYNAWLGDSGKPGTVLGTLPGAGDYRPTVRVECLPDLSCEPPASPAISTSRVIITLRWRMPAEEIKGEGAPECKIPGQDEVKWHCFVLVAQMNAVNN